MNDEGGCKQPDQSYTPDNLPPPSRNNKVKLQANGDNFPSLVLEVAVSNEDRQRLINDACTKYLTETTSVKVWVGIKVDKTVIGREVFWAGWGRRKLVGKGLKLEEQTEDDDGSTIFLPVALPAGVQGLLGNLEIPSQLIFEPKDVPATSPPTFTLPFEDIRQWVARGLR